MAPKALLKPVAAEIVEIVPEGSAGHSLWLAPSSGWHEAPTPGQFCMVWLAQPPTADPSARAACDNIPMSVAGWEPGRVMVTIADLGPTTHGLLACAEGELLGLTGPLGKGFDWAGYRNLLLVGGGVGAPPLRYLAERAAVSEGLAIHTLLGAATESAMFSRADFASLSNTLALATDDGSAGHHGYVTDLLEGAASAIAGGNGTEPDLLAACGPEPMLVKALAWAEANGVTAQLCLERYMACGIGVCGVCTVDKHLVCSDGPVLTGEQLRGSREFGRVIRGPGGTLKV